MMTMEGDISMAMISEECPDDSPLLEKGVDKPMSAAEEKFKHANTGKCRLEGKCCYLLELCFAMYLTSNVATTPVSQFYVYDQIAKSYGIPHYIQDDGANSCHRNNSDIINKIQKDASHQLMYMSFLSSFTAVIPAIFLGNISDKYGRKVSFLIIISGLLLHQIVYIILFVLEAPLPYLYIGNVIEGITGYISSAFMVAFIMLADITSAGKERGFRIALLEGVVAITVSLAILGSGFWIKYSGFLVPLIFATGLCLLTIVVWIITIPETKPFTTNESRRILSRNSVIRCFVFYYEKSPKKRRGKMFALLIIFLLAAAVILSKSNVIVLFLLNQPFCWTELHITIVTSVQILVNWPVGILLLRLLQRVMSDAGLLVWGCFFGVASLLPLAFAYSDWMVYLYTAAATLPVVVLPITRSFLSKHASPEEQGALFAGIAATEHLVTGCGGLLFGVIYKQTVEFFPGLVFFVICGLMLLALVLAVCLYKWISPDK